MEFLKNHYEKLILSLVLLLMAGGAVMLVLEAGSVESQLAEFKKPLVAQDGQKPPPPDPLPFRIALSNAQQPRLLDLNRDHRVFNPELWLVDTNGNLIPGREVGPHKLVVTRIEPLNLKLELGITITDQRTTYVFRGVKEYESTPSQQRIPNTPIDLARTNAVVLDRNRKILALVREIKNPGENAEIHYDLSIGGEIKPMPPLTKAAPVSTVIEYSAALEYKPENLKWPYRVPPQPPLPPVVPPQLLMRRDAPLYFAGDTNIIIEVTASNVVVKAVSNDKPTTIPLGPVPPPAPGRKSP